jgi:hypothetical protein
MTIDWTKPLEFTFDGTPLILDPNVFGTNPDKDGDYVLVREDGLAPTSDQLNGANFSNIIVRPTGTQWGESETHQIVRNRIPINADAQIWTQAQAIAVKHGLTLDDLPEPVDPVLLAARQIVSDRYLTSNKWLSERYRDGALDHCQMITLAMTGVRHGLQMAVQP